MKWFPIVFAVALAGQVAARAEAGTDRADTSGGGGHAALGRR